MNYVDAWGLTASDKGENDESNTLGRILGYIGSFTKDILGITAIGMGKALEWSAPFLGGLAAIGANYETGGAALAYSSSIAAAVTVATKSLGAALAKQGQALLHKETFGMIMKMMIIRPMNVSEKTMEKHPGITKHRTNR